MAKSGRQDPRVGAGSNQTATESKSAKGLKAASDISISSGRFTIDSTDDAIHSNNSITIAGGDIAIASGDDGVHADSSLRIEGGTLNITKSYEGLESKRITISGGETHVIASDDGINIAGGNDGSSITGRPGRNTFSSSGDNALHINGGYLAIDALGDGVDANGSISMTDGTVIVSGPTANNNGALDYDAAFEMTGGLLVAAGSAGMAQAPSNESSQYSIMMTFTRVQQAGTLVSLKDSKENTVLTFAPKRQYQTIVISSPELAKGETYTLYSGGTSTGSLADGVYVDGVYQGGTKVVSFPISSSVTWLSETGVTTNPGGGRKGR